MIPDNKNSGGGFVFRGGEDHRHFSDLPGLQQQTKNSFSFNVQRSFALTRL